MVIKLANKGTIILQDAFLNALRKDRIPVTIYLVNGFQYRGIVKGFDNFTIILENDGRQNMLYKHAISSVNPVRPVSFGGNNTNETKED